MAKKPVSANTHQVILIRQAYDCNQLFIKYQARGEAINIAIAISFIKSFDNKPATWVTVAPSTLRMPISLMRFTAASAARPNKPKQARKIEIPPAQPTMAL